VVAVRQDRRPGYTATKLRFPLPMVAVRQDWGEGGRRPGEGDAVHASNTCAKAKKPLLKRIPGASITLSNYKPQLK
jgi:hypothetical protein